MKNYILIISKQAALFVCSAFGKKKGEREQRQRDPNSMALERLTVYFSVSFH